jgi:hypothetical protein
MIYVLLHCLIHTGTYTDQQCTVMREEAYQTPEACKAALAQTLKLAPGLAATHGGGESGIFWENKLVCAGRPTWTEVQ